MQTKRYWMIQYLKSLSSDLAFYGVIIGASRAVSIFVLPLLISLLGNQYGNYDTIIVLITFVSIFGLFGQQAALSRYFYEEDSINYRRAVISTSFIINILATGFFLSILILFTPFIQETYLPPSLDFNPIWYVIVGVPSIVIFQTCQNIFRLQFFKWAYGLLSIGQIFLFLLLLLIPLGHSLGEIISYYIGSYTVFSCLGLFILRKDLRFQVHKQLSKELIEFGLPYFLISLSLTFTPLMERGVVNHLYNDEKVLSNYAVGARVAMLIGILLQSFQVAWTAFAYSVLKRENVSFIYSLIFNIYVTIVSIGILLVVLFRDLIFGILASEFSNSISEVLILPLMLAFAFNSFSMISGLGIDVAKKTTKNLYIFIASLILSIILIYLLGSNFGLLGIAVGVMSGKLSLWLIKNLVSNRFSNIRFNIHYSFIPLAFVLVIARVSYTYTLSMASLCTLLMLILTSTILYIYFLYKKWNFTN